MSKQMDQFTKAVNGDADRALVDQAHGLERRAEGSVQAEVDAVVREGFWIFKTERRITGQDEDALKGKDLVSGGVSVYDEKGLVGRTSYNQNDGQGTLHVTQRPRDIFAGLAGIALVIDGFLNKHFTRAHDNQHGPLQNANEGEPPRIANEDDPIWDSVYYMPLQDSYAAEEFEDDAAPQLAA